MEPQSIPTKIKTSRFLQQKNVLIPSVKKQVENLHIMFAYLYHPEFVMKIRQGIQRQTSNQKNIHN